MLNPLYIEALVTRINAAQSCDELTTLSSDALADLNTLNAAVSAQIANLEILIISVTDLPSVLRWVNAAIAYISGPEAALIAELGTVAAAISEATAALASKAQSLGC